MAGISRQQRRDDHRKLRKLHPSFIREGLKTSGTMDIAVSLALLFRDRMNGGKDGDAMISATRLAHDLYETSVRKHKDLKPVHCEAGCHFCCHCYTIHILAVEAFVIAHTIAAATGEDATPTSGSFTERAQAWIAADPDGTVPRKNLACPMLRDRQCSIHPARPLVCRMHNTSFVQACIDNYNGASRAVPLEQDRLIFGEGCSVGLRAALKSLGLPADLYEMNRAVDVVLRTDSAMERWLGGEDIFIDVPRLDDIPGEVSNAIDMIAARIS